AKIDAAQTKVNAAKQDVQAKTKAKNDAQAELDKLTNSNDNQPSDPKENDKEAKVKQAQTKLTEATNALTKAQADLKTAEDELNKLKTDKAEQAKIDAAQTKVNAAKQDVQAKTKAKNDAQAELDKLTNSNDKM
ncbi:cell envelope biogenesis protein TolA, partial [Ureaplasma urealyticum]